MEGVASDLEICTLVQCKNDPMDTNTASKRSAQKLRDFLSKIPHEALHRFDNSSGLLFEILYRLND